VCVIAALCGGCIDDGNGASWCFFFVFHVRCHGEKVGGKAGPRFIEKESKEKETRG